MMRILLILIFLATPTWAVEPDEILPDPVMEARARVISKGLRCLVCRNENIDSSSAGIAKDLRILVRERLVDGDSNDQVMSYIVDRYGEYVLLKPKFTVKNLVPWLSGPVLFFLGLFLSIKFISRPRRDIVAALDEDEEKRLDDILAE
ncbi:MAG: cytochrome c-type biogenesis protein CcmH [Amylibacter sp.]|nr:cytochrome c-type biogenesis protein CcmH [Amylibacter sp.]